MSEQQHGRQTSYLFQQYKNFQSHEALNALMARFLEKANRWVPRPRDWPELSDRDNDIIQEAAIKTLSKLDEFQWRGSDSFWSYCCHIVKNTMKDCCRKVMRERGHVVACENLEDLPALEEEISTMINLALLREAEERVQLTSTTKAAARNFRSYMLRHYGKSGTEPLAYEDIARELNCDLSATQRGVFLVRRAVRETYERLKQEGLMAPTTRQETENDEQFATEP